MKYSVHIDIDAGLSFSKDFYLTNADLSPVDITDATVTGYLAKHANAFFATDTTSEHTFYNYIPFTCSIKDGPNGIYTLELADTETILLKEGKYTFIAAIVDENGVELGIGASGLAFVTSAMNPDFGTIGPQSEVPVTIPATGE